VGSVSEERRLKFSSRIRSASCARASYLRLNDLTVCSPRHISTCLNTSSATSLPIFRSTLKPNPSKNATYQLHHKLNSLAIPLLWPLSIFSGVWSDRHYTELIRRLDSPFASSTASTPSKSSSVLNPSSCKAFCKKPLNGLVRPPGPFVDPSCSM
jgi:hypothetical protein